MPTLTRIKPTQPDAALVAAREELARRAKTELGYERLQDALGSRPLLAMLTAMGVRPFTAGSVARYKKSHRHEGMFTGTKQFLVFLALLPVTAGGAWWLWTLPDSIAFGVLTILVALLAILNLLVVLGSIGDIGKGKRRRVDWRILPIAQFTGDIPEFALNRALEIRTAIPGCSFQIDGLYTTTEERPLPDPFLVVVRKGEAYYVDVWDEKGYQIEYFPGC